MTEYRAIYKCRKCGACFGNTVTGDENLAQKTLICACIGTPSGEAQAPALHFPHSCANGDFGVADFIGWQKEEKREITTYKFGFSF